MLKVKQNIFKNIHKCNASYTSEKLELETMVIAFVSAHTKLKFTHEMRDNEC